MKANMIQKCLGAFEHLSLGSYFTGEIIHYLPHIHNSFKFKCLVHNLDSIYPVVNTHTSPFRQIVSLHEKLVCSLVRGHCVGKKP